MQCSEQAPKSSWAIAYEQLHRSNDRRQRLPATDVCVVCCRCCVAFGIWQQAGRDCVASTVAVTDPQPVEISAEVQCARCMPHCWRVCHSSAQLCSSSGRLSVCLSLFLSLCLSLCLLVAPSLHVRLLYAKFSHSCICQMSLAKCATLDQFERGCMGVADTPRGNYVNYPSTA